MQLRYNLDLVRYNLDATYMQLRYKLELMCHLDQFRYCLDSVKILFRLGVDGKILRIRLTLAKVLVEVEAKLGNFGHYLKGGHGSAVQPNFSFI